MVAPLQGTGQRTLGIVVVNVAALVVSFFVHNLGVVNVFNGACSVFVFVGLFPVAVARGVLAYKVPSEPLLSNRADDGLGEKNARYRVLLMTMLTLVSFVAMVLGLIGDGNGADGPKLTLCFGAGKRVLLRCATLLRVRASRIRDTTLLLKVVRRASRRDT
eukprot:TRINITY_DN18499_c0_g1_i2.p2 TRINITY_DN18499_c0_g1~~TRINITY_DN18499_c0_g1_i2.p2  ORF type:complete len:161 (-),score=14.47 TRINITY_DN18499_c0_g1_i2:132-614(-)